jgi:two-component system chemotaxis sensor kinase CheA
MNQSEFLPIFLEEAFEILERWESTCLKLDKDASEENLNDLFRSAHNLKGSARSVGLSEFGKFVHVVEDLITNMKSGQLSVSAEIVSLILDCQRQLLNWVEGLKADSSLVLDSTHLVQEIVSLSSPKENASTDSFGFFDDETPVQKTSSNSTETGNPQDLGTILIESGHVSQLQIEEAVRVQNLKLGEILVDRGVTSPQVVKQALENQKNQGHKPDETIRVSLRKLDTVIRLVGEMSIQHAIIKGAKESGDLNNAHTIEAISLTDKVIQDLQTEAMGLRMQPLENLFQRMERVARDVASSLGKEIRVVLKGADVELDKTVIERMKDPLVHILRNAVDHGIESPEARAQSGKNKVATITIEGVQTAANVGIIISDDGRGINEEIVLSIAKSKGLVPSDAKLTPEQIHQLIFMPGFSTADKVTDVSGRGVGLDVVKRAVDEIGGQAIVQSVQSKGTNFKITLPSTLSILDAVVISLDNNLYALPIQDIDEVVHISDNLIEKTPDRGRMMNLRGKIMPVERLSDYLPSRIGKKSASDGVAVVANHNRTSIAFEVDRIMGQQQIVVRQIDDALAKIPGFTGATILSSGEPSMIVHLSHIVKSYVSTIKS